MENYSPKEIINVNAPVNAIKCGDAWEQLDLKEKMYAYYFYKASWEGSMICWFQRSYESPALFILLNIVFSQNIERLKEKSLAIVSEDEWNMFHAYAAGVFNN
jgi:dipeptidyl-peptidase III